MCKKSPRRLVSQQKEGTSCRVFPAQHLASAPMTPMLLLIYITKQLLYGGRGGWDHCHCVFSNAAVLTNTPTSRFLFVNKNNFIPASGAAVEMLTRSPQPPFAAGRPASRRATLQSECGQSVSPCFLISLQRHRAWKYTTEQRMGSLLQQRAQANKSRGLNKGERGEVSLRGGTAALHMTDTRNQAQSITFGFVHHPSAAPLPKELAC